MSKDEAKLSSFHKKRYAQWAGNEAGIPADPKKCCEQVYQNYRFYQCHKPRGHGPEEAYCFVHSPAEIKRKRDLQDITYEKKARIRKIESSGPELLAAIRKIAEGHNDAMGLAQETLTNLNLW